MLGAFANSKQLEEIKIPKTINKLGLNTFRRSGLQSIELYNNTEFKEDDTIDSTFPKNTDIQIIDE